MVIKSLAQTLKDLATGIKNTITGVTGSNATLTIIKGNGTTSTVTVNNVANATNATKATQDSAGQQINTTYIKGLSISGKTITYTKGNGSTGTITVPTGTGAKSYITESVVNADGSWYRKYSDGWLEQGGIVSTGTTGTVTYLKAYADELYSLLFTTVSSSKNAMDYVVCCPNTKTTTTFTYTATTASSSRSWYACGMGAE